MPPWEVFLDGRERPGGVVCGPVGEKSTLVQGLAWPGLKDRQGVC